MGRKAVLRLALALIASSAALAMSATRLVAQSPAEEIQRLPEPQPLAFDSLVTPAGGPYVAETAAARVSALEARLAEMEAKLGEDKKSEKDEGYVIGSDLNMTAKWQHGLEISTKNKDFVVGRRRG